MWSVSRCSTPGRSSISSEDFVIWWGSVRRLLLIVSRVLHKVKQSRVSKFRPRGVRRNEAAESIIFLGQEMPIPCSTCSRQSRRCFVSDGSTDCAECVRHGAKSCDIGLSMSQVERLKKTRDDLQRQLEEAEEAKLEVVVRERRLRKQLALVDSRAKEMFEKEEAILKSLDA